MTIIWLIEQAQSWKSSLLRLVSPAFPVRTLDARMIREKDYPKPCPGSPGCLLVNEDTCRDQKDLVRWSEDLARQYRFPAVFLSKKYSGLHTVRDLFRKPGELKELLVRIHSDCRSGVLLRLLGSLEPENQHQDILRYRDLEYDQESMSIRIAGETELTGLTPKEARILKLFMVHPGRCWSRVELQNQVWNGLRVSPRTIDSQISRLRKKLKYSGILVENKYGDGYIFR